MGGGGQVNQPDEITSQWIRKSKHHTTEAGTALLYPYAVWH
jgi:hypothetical protein